MRKPSCLQSLYNLLRQLLYHQLIRILNQNFMVFELLALSGRPQPGYRRVTVIKHRSRMSIICQLVSVLKICARKIQTEDSKMKIIIFLFYFLQANDFWKSIKDYIMVSAAVNGIFSNNLAILAFLS